VEEDLVRGVKSSRIRVCSRTEQRGRRFQQRPTRFSPNQPPIILIYSPSLSPSSLLRRRIPKPHPSQSSIPILGLIAKYNTLDSCDLLTRLPCSMLGISRCRFLVLTRLWMRSRGVETSSWDVRDHMRLQT
jgi:hypothetical protein